MKHGLSYGWAIAACGILASAGGMWWLMRPESQPVAISSLPAPIQPVQTERLSPVRNPELNWRQQIGAVAGLKAPLAPEELEFLLAELRLVPADHEAEKQWVVQNEIMEVLREKGMAPDRLTPELVALIRDASISEVTRDYAVQHLAQWLFPQLPGVPKENDAQRRAEGLDALIVAASDPVLNRGTIQGTALNVLMGIFAQLPPEEAGKLWGRLEPVVIAEVAAPTQNDIARKSTAIRVAGLRKTAACYDVIRRLATDESEHPALRLSAVASLGRYGHPQDQEILTELSRSAGPLQPAALTALRQFNAPSR